jgi:predicted phage tail protein
LNEGAHTLVVTAVDRVGNKGTGTLHFQTRVLSAVCPAEVPGTGAASLSAGLGAMAMAFGISMVALTLTRRRYR